MRIACPICRAFILLDFEGLLGWWECPECNEEFAVWAADYEAFDMSDRRSHKLTIRIGEVTEEVREDKRFIQTIRKAEIEKRTAQTPKK